jgi:hypothetical protein
MSVSRFFLNVHVCPRMFLQVSGRGIPWFCDLHHWLDLPDCSECCAVALLPGLLLQHQQLLGQGVLLGVPPVPLEPIDKGGGGSSSSYINRSGPR